MATKRTIAIAAAGGVALAAVVWGGASLAADDDRREPVAAVEVGPVEGPLPSGAPTGGAGQQVAGLDPLEGVFERRGDDRDDFLIGAVELDFGPEEWVLTAGPLGDYDRDGTTENLVNELDGLVGQPVTALVRLDDSGHDADVYVLNDLAYRDPAGAAPWLQAGGAAGPAADMQAVADAAVRAVGPGARLEDLDREDDGRVAWEAEVLDAGGREHVVLLDAAGTVLHVGLDD